MEIGPLVVDGGPWALVSLFVVLIATGRLIPRKTHEDVRTDAEKWEKAWHLQNAALAELTAANKERDKQLLELLEIARTTETVLRAFIRAMGVQP